MIPERELEVKLPRAAIFWHIAVLIRERDAELDDLQHVDVALECLEVIIVRVLKHADRPRHHAGEFSILLSPHPAASMPNRIMRMNKANE
jgi:hypothetical protein